jgi:hypothetical protein
LRELGHPPVPVATTVHDLQAGDRQVLVGHLSVAHGAEKPVLLTLEETLALPAVLALAALLALICQALSRILEAVSSIANPGLMPQARAASKDT